MISLEDDFLFCSLCDDQARLRWRYARTSSAEGIEVAKALGGAEGVVHLLALEFSWLPRWTNGESCHSEPACFERLRELLGVDFNKDRIDLFWQVQTQAPPTPPGSWFQRGNLISLGGLPAVLCDWLGSGGQAEVWSVRFTAADTQADRAKIAVKFEHRRPQSGETSNQTGLEGRWAQKLCFLPGIPIYWGDDEVVNGRRVVCTEVVAGESLRDRLQHGEKFPPRDAARIVERVATTLGCIHAIGITHRDINSANILLSPSDSPWLIDFALASSTGDASEDGRGTPLYSAPEQTRNQPRADVFSLGTVLFELLSGRPWETYKDRTAALDAVLPGTRPAFRIPDRLLDILRCCLSHCPGDRYADAMELAQSLRNYLIQDRAQDGEPIQRRPGPVAVLAEIALEKRVGLACSLEECRTAIKDGLSKPNISKVLDQDGVDRGEDLFRDATEALLSVVHSGVAKRIANDCSGLHSLDDLARDVPETPSLPGNRGWWAIEEWGWLLGKTWVQEPAKIPTPLEWLYSSVLNATILNGLELKRTAKDDAARQFRLRHQTMKAQGWLAWMDEKRGLWEMAVRHRVAAEQTARDTGVSYLILEAGAALAGTILKRPSDQDADLDRVAKLLDSAPLNDGGEAYLRHRQFVKAEIDIRRGKTTASERLRLLLTEISQDEPDCEGWLLEAYHLFLRVNLIPDAQWCLDKMLDRVRGRNGQKAERWIRASAAFLSQRRGDPGWETLFDELLAETESFPDEIGPIALVASETHFNANQFERAIELADKALKNQQVRGNCESLVRTEGHLALCYDRSGNFKRAIRWAIVAISTAIYQTDLSGLDGILRHKLSSWEQYNEVYKLLSSLLEYMNCAGEQKVLDDLWTKLDELVRGDLLSDDDRVCILYASRIDGHFSVANDSPAD